MRFPITFQKFGTVPPNLHNTVSDEVVDSLLKFIWKQDKLELYLQKSLEDHYRCV